MTRKNCLTSAWLLASLAAAAQPPTISFQNQNITGLSQPLDIVSANDGTGRMFIVEKAGMVKMWTGGTTTAYFLDMSSTGEQLVQSSGSEEGLLSIAFHPDHDGVTNRFFFVYYTDITGNLALRRYETQVGNPNEADTTTDQLLLTIPHPGNANHNGGKLNFGTDGYLYFATGDGGGGGDVPNNAQNGNVLLGKMLRLDVDNPSVTYGLYSVPPDNPYVSDAGIDDRIYALGLRNPFRWSFDRANGNIWIGDVGQGSWEEVNFRSASDAAGGTNYGWRCYEGNHPFNTAGCAPMATYIFPVLEYANTSSAAVTGGYVYRGSEYPGFIGYYIAADFISGNVYLTWPDGSGGWNSSVQTGPTTLAGFGEAEDGRLFAVSLSGSVYKVEATGGTVLPVRLASFTARRLEIYNEIRWTTGFEENTARFHIEYSTNGSGYSRAGTVAASGNSQGSSYVFNHHYNSGGPVYYRLLIEDLDARTSYSQVLKIAAAADRTRIWPTIVDNAQLTISTRDALQHIQIIATSGAVVHEQAMKGFAGSALVGLPQLPNGVYLVRLLGQGWEHRQKIIVRQ